MDERKETLSFFIYMWNKWNEEEAVAMFGKVMGNHFWNKWENSENLERFVAELDEDNLDVIVTRACQLYTGRKNKKIID